MYTIKPFRTYNHCVFTFSEEWYFVRYDSRIYLTKSYTMYVIYQNKIEKDNIFICLNCLFKGHDTG